MTITEVIIALTDIAAWLREHAEYVDPAVREGYDSLPDSLDAAIEALRYRV